jgi:hypothetical protein
VSRPTEAILTLSDRMNNAYISQIFNETFVLSGQQFMPFSTGLKKETQKLMNYAGFILYPILLSMNLPVFLYNIVFEKEQKLLENMKINGLRMSNYYIVNAFYNFS